MLTKLLLICSIVCFLHTAGNIIADEESEWRTFESGFGKSEEDLEGEIDYTEYEDSSGEKDASKVLVETVSVRQEQQPITDRHDEESSERDIIIDDFEEDIAGGGGIIIDEDGDDENRKGSDSMVKRPLLTNERNLFTHPGILAAIVFVCLLGLFCLGLFILLIFVCVRRRRDKGTYTLDKALNEKLVHSKSDSSEKEFFA